MALLATQDRVNGVHAWMMELPKITNVAGGAVSVFTPTLVLITILCLCLHWKVVLFLCHSLHIVVDCQDIKSVTGNTHGKQIRHVVTVHR